MSRTSARAGIAAYFTNAASAGGLPYVGTVYPARPVIMEETAYTQTMLGTAVAQTPSGSSAVLVVNLPTDRRQRRADTGRGAVQDTNIHDVALEVFFASAGGTSGQTQDNGINAQQDYDTIIDTLVDLIRDDPTMGGIAWSAGEYDAGVEHSQNEPHTSPDGMSVLIVGVLRWQFWDWVAGGVTPP